MSRLLDDDEAQGITQEAHDSAVKAAWDKGLTEGSNVGATAAYARISAILASEKVKGREAFAMKLAAKSPDMSAEDVIEITADVPAAPVAAVKPIGERSEATGVDALAAGTTGAGPTGNAGGGSPEGGDWNSIMAKANASRQPRNGRANR